MQLYRCIWSPRVSEAAAPARARVVLMHGYGEHCRRYDEFAQYLLEQDFEVWRFDARGHGQSSGQRGYVADFSDYVRDLANEVARAERAQPSLPLFLMGHSNGGLAAILAVETGLAFPRGLIVSNPLLGLVNRPVPDVLARILSRLVPRLPLPNGIQSHELTHDPALVEAHRRDRLVHRAATPRWYWSMTLAGREAIALASSLNLPLLTLRAGRDALVDSARVLDFHARVGSSNKELINVDDAFHELLNEVGRERTFERISSWMERVLAGGGTPPLTNA